jgi:tetratricopeptide (TPR) repeat protein
VKFLPLCVVLALLLLGCKKGERAQRDLDSLYSKAYSQKASGDISLAIESFQRLLALDSLRATTYRLELLSLYEQTGNFRTALALLDSLPTVDSLQAKRLLFLVLLGETDVLKKYLRQKFPLTPADELLLAELYLKEKEYDRAQFHLAAVSQSSHVLAAIEALGKLAMLFDGYRQNGADSSTFFFAQTF